MNNLDHFFRVSSWLWRNPSFPRNGRWELWGSRSSKREKVPGEWDRGQQKRKQARIIESWVSLPTLHPSPGKAPNLLEPHPLTLKQSTGDPGWAHQAQGSQEKWGHQARHQCLAQMRSWITRRYLLVLILLHQANQTPKSEWHKPSVFQQSLPGMQSWGSPGNHCSDSHQWVSSA